MPLPLPAFGAAIRRRGPIALLALLAAAFAAGQAHGQSDAQLRAENESLRTRVNDLDLELKAAKARIAELERKLADATARLAASGAAAGGAVPPPAEQPATIDESVANASPRALLHAMQGDYATTMGPVGGWATPKDRTIYYRTLEKWIAAANRRYRAPVDWLVRIEEVAAIGERTASVRAVAIDPGSGADLGDPFLIMVPLALHRRLDSAQLLAPGSYLALRGALLPDARFNERRETIGPFDQPRFVGPFCELMLTVDAQSLSAVRETAWPPPMPTAPAARPVPPVSPATPAPVAPASPVTPAPPPAGAPAKPS